MLVTVSFHEYHCVRSTHIYTFICVLMHSLVYEKLELLYDTGMSTWGPFWEAVIIMLLCCTLRLFSSTSKCSFKGEPCSTVLFQHISGSGSAFQSTVREILQITTLKRCFYLNGAFLSLCRWEEPSLRFVPSPFQTAHATLESIIVKAVFNMWMLDLQTTVILLSDALRGDWRTILIHFIYTCIKL